MATSALIGFGDADAFYSSAEVVRKPWLAGLPVGVLGNQGACVIARSYAMKKFGVKVGEPIWEARRKCPEGVYVKRDFRWYETLSRKMLATVGAFGHQVEYYSIDEFFWHAHPQPGRPWQSIAEDVRARVMQQVGVPMTVAYARTRTLAKLFADTAKPFGAIAVTDADHEVDLLGQLPVHEVAGIGKRRADKLGRYGIFTCLDLRRARGATIEELLTVVGHDLWAELNGDPVQAIRPTRTPRKMISRGGSLAGHVKDAHTLYGWLVRNVERLIEELQFHEVRPSALTVYVNYFEGPSGSGTVRLEVPTGRFAALLQAAKLGLRRAWRPGAVATHLHLLASGLRGPESWQRSLFEPDGDTGDDIADLKRQVNGTLGRFALRSGATLYANDFYADPAYLHEICDVRDKFCF